MCVEFLSFLPFFWVTWGHNSLSSLWVSVGTFRGCPSSAQPNLENKSGAFHVVTDSEMWVGI